MPRYVTRRPRADDRDPWEIDVPLLPAISVDQTEPQPIGLMDKNGNDIVRLPGPIGFLTWHAKS